MPLKNISEMKEIKYNVSKTKTIHLKIPKSSGIFLHIRKKSVDDLKCHSKIKGTNKDHVL